MRQRAEIARAALEAVEGVRRSIATRIPGKS
jgi:hypothetical protein